MGDAPDGSITVLLDSSPVAASDRKHDVSDRTVHAEWRLARAWLTRELAPE